MNNDIELPENIENYGVNKAKYFWLDLMYKLLFEDDITNETKNFIYENTRGMFKIDSTKNFILHEQFKNLSLEIDGNPVYLCHMYDINKSLRIIQESPTEELLEIGAWIQPAAEHQKLDELVISLELNNKSYPIVKALIYYWLFQSKKNEDMNEFIDQLF